MSRLILSVILLFTLFSPIGWPNHVCAAKDIKTIAAIGYGSSREKAIGNACISALEQIIEEAGGMRMLTSMYAELEDEVFVRYPRYIVGCDNISAEVRGETTVVLSDVKLDVSSLINKVASMRLNRYVHDVSATPDEAKHRLWLLVKGVTHSSMILPLELELKSIPGLTEYQAHYYAGRVISVHAICKGSPHEIASALERSKSLLVTALEIAQNTKDIYVVTTIK